MAASVAMSHIAWSPEQDAEMHTILQRRHWCLEVAATRELQAPPPSGGIVSAQSLCWGKPELQLFDSFGGPLVHHITHIASELPATVKTLVFGSPKNRVCPENVSEDLAIPVFRAIADADGRRVLCIEHNPAEYGTNFLCTPAEAGAFVRRTSHPRVCLSFDTGCAQMSGLGPEDAYAVLMEYADILGHVQVAEPFLGPVSHEQSWRTFHAAVARALFDMGYAKCLSVEMRALKDDGANKTVTAAMDFVEDVYHDVIRPCPLRLRVIGGGYYGCHLAAVLQRAGHQVTLFERNAQLMAEASSKNQSRLHMGFHYPRSFATRKHMPAHFFRFVQEYGHLIRMRGSEFYNFYAVADSGDSLMDLATYVDIVRHLPSHFVYPTDMGFAHLQQQCKVIRCEEAVVDSSFPKGYFTTHLQELGVNLRLGECVASAETPSTGEYDYTLNCTYNQLEPLEQTLYELCISLVYRDSRAESDCVLGLTIMDGPFCSIYPYTRGEDEFVGITLTSVKYTPYFSNTSLEQCKEAEANICIAQIIPLFEQEITAFYPAFCERYTFDSYFTSIKAKPLHSASAERTCSVRLDEAKRVIHVWSGKINNIFEAEAQVPPLLGLPPVKQPLGARVALIGFTGFVGSTLARQGQFTHFYNSKNIDQIYGAPEFDLVVCAGAPGRKWYANKHAVEDRQSIDRLQYFLKHVKAREFVLISTIDVLEDAKNPYGVHRRFLENFCLSTFNKCSIVRLPALFGKGLRKNVLYDLLFTEKQDIVVHSASEFQWYHMDDLMQDLTIVRASSEKAIFNLFTVPLGMSFILDLVPNARQRIVENTYVIRQQQPANHVHLFGAPENAHYIRNTKAALREFIKNAL